MLCLLQIGLEYGDLMVMMQLIGGCMLLDVEWIYKFEFEEWPLETGGGIVDDFECVVFGGL